MTVRSVLDVDVQAQSFERFQQLFDAYSEKLRKQPEIWRKINEQHTKLADGFSSFGNKLDQHFNAVHDLKDEQEANEKSLEHSGSLWSGIEKSSGRTAKHVISATTSLLKWTGLLSGVTGLLGYLTLGGIMDLGSDVYGYRKQAAGLGTTIGQSRAFDISFGRLLGSPQGFLSGISSATANIASPGYAMLNALGVNPNGSTSQVAVSTLEALRTKVRATPIDQLGILEQIYHLGSLGLGVDDLRRLKTMGNPEYQQLLGTYRTQQGALNLSDRTGKAWTDFITKMDTAKGLIENVFVRDLVNLSGPIYNLTNGFTDLLTKIGQKNGPLAQGIDKIGKWIDSFSGEISKPKFISGLERFVDIFSFFGTVSDVGHDTPPKPGARGFWATLFEGPTPGSVASRFRSETAWALGMYGKRSHWLHVANKMDPSGLLTVVGKLESGMNPYTPDSPKGAEGMMQIMPSVARAAGVNPYDPEQSLDYANRELGLLYKEYHGHLNRMLAAYNWGEGNVNRDIARYGSAWQQHLPAETLNYLIRAQKMLAGMTNVHIVNATGGSAAASVSGLGGQR